MIGYAPFLGQVKILRRALGQDDVDLALQEEQQVMEWDYATAKRWYSAWAPLVSNKTACLGDVYVTRFFEYIDQFISGFERQALPEGAPIPIRVWMVKAIEKIHACTGMESVAPSDLPKAPAQTAAGAELPSPPESDGIPSWAYVVGGVAAAGLVAYIASRD